MLKITENTPCKTISDHILQKYPDVENRTLAIIFEDLLNLDNRHPGVEVSDAIDLVKQWQYWEHAYENKLELPEYTDDFIFSVPTENPCPWA